MNVPPWLPWTNLGVVGTAFLIVDMIIRIVALGVVPHNRRPSAAWGWLVMIFFLPTGGAVGFLLIGNSRLGRERSRKQKSIRHYLPGTPAVPVPAPAKPEWASTAVSLVRADGGLPLTEGNKADVLTGYTHALALTPSVRHGRLSTSSSTLWPWTKRPNLSSRPSKRPGRGGHGPGAA